MNDAPLPTPIPSYITGGRFRQIEGMYYLSNPAKHAGREAVMRRAREAEGRVYADAEVRKLPLAPGDHRHADEWIMRADSAQHFQAYVAGRAGEITLLEIGCGNGWRVNRLAALPHCTAVGLDIERLELEQGARVFGGRDALIFAYGEVLDGVFPPATFDVIVLAGSANRYPNLATLTPRLLDLLRPGGEIHIFDTPFYDESALESATRQVQEHFARLGVPERADFYYLHSWSELEAFNPTLLHDPNRLRHRVRRTLLAQMQSPYPWLRISVPSP